MSVISNVCYLQWSIDICKDATYKCGSLAKKKMYKKKNFKKITKIQKIKEEDEAVVKTKEIQIKLQGNPIIYIEKKLVLK